VNGFRVARSLNALRIGECAAALLLIVFVESAHASLIANGDQSLSSFSTFDVGTFATVVAFVEPPSNPSQNQGRSGCLV
jgi:hypothetical protein